MIEAEFKSGEKKKRNNGILAISVLLVMLSAALAIVTVLCYGSGIFVGNSIYIVMELTLIVSFLITILIFIVNVIHPLLMIERIMHEPTEKKEHRRCIFKTPTQENNAFFRLYAQLSALIDKNRDMTVHEYSLQMLKKQAELAALQSQINPHFLYNTLDCIRGIAIEQGSNDIEVMSKALSDMFRYSISGKQTQVRLCDELENMHNYFTIQQYRFNNKLHICEEIDQDTRECSVPKLIIQPIVENAVFYGLEPKVGNCKINIRSYRTRKRLIINIEDNGMGISLEKSSMLNDALNAGVVIPIEGKGTKIGLANVNERIKLLYGEEYGLKLFSCLNVGTNVEITLPAE